MGAAGAAAGVSVPGTAAAAAVPAPATPRRPGALVPGAEALARELGPPRQETAADRYIVENPGSDFMVDVLKSLNLKYCTSNPGSSFEGLQESIVNYGNNQMPEFLTCLHEESAVGMAHGYAKITGEPMMVLLHGTVGLLHGAMAIYNAFADRVPIYIVVGSHKEPGGGVNAYHSAQDMGALVRDYVKWDAEPITLERFAEYAVRAYKIMMTPPQEPVMFTVDHDLQEEPADASLRVPRLTMTEPPAGDRNAVREVASMLLAAERPLITSQRLARTQTGIDDLIELAELLEVPVQDSERVNFPNRHPLAGNGGGANNYSPDLIMGLEVNDMSPTTRAAQGADRKTIGISSLELSHGRNTYDYGRYAELDLNIAADAQATLPYLIEEVKQQTTSNDRVKIAARGPQVREANHTARVAAMERARYGWNSSPVSLARLCGELWPLIKEDDWSLVSWQGFIGGWPGRLWDMSKKYHYIGGQGAGGIGYSAPASVGAALANREEGRLSINLQTDGDLNFAPGVLWTAVHHEIPLLTVMANNRAYHAEVMFLQRTAAERNRGVDRAAIGTTITDPNIDYATMARGYGMHGIGPIDNPNELRPALIAALERVRGGEPVLIDLVTQPRG